VDKGGGPPRGGLPSLPWATAYSSFLLLMHTVYVPRHLNDLAAHHV
jgi:hypothetical protein